MRMGCRHTLNNCRHTPYRHTYTYNHMVQICLQGKAGPRNTMRTLPHIVEARKMVKRHPINLPAHPGVCRHRVKDRSPVWSVRQCPPVSGITRSYRLSKPPAIMIVIIEDFTTKHVELRPTFSGQCRIVSVGATKVFGRVDWPNKCRLGFKVFIDQ